MPLPVNREPLNLPDSWLHPLAFSLRFQSAMGTTARSTPSISSSSATGSRWYIWGSIVTSAISFAPPSRRTWLQSGFRVTTAGTSIFSPRSSDNCGDTAPATSQSLAAAAGRLPHEDARIMKRKGVDQIFFAGTSLTEMADYVGKHYGKAHRRRPARKAAHDLALARELTADRRAPSPNGSKTLETRPEDRRAKRETAQSHRFHRAGRGGQRRR